MQPLMTFAATANPVAARSQMGFSLGWHIIIASFGVGLPILVLLAEYLGHRKNDPIYKVLARRWAKVLGVLFAVGAVSGTIVSFEMGSLFAGFLGHYGSVIGLPFAIEGIAFFIEAIFLGIYLYGWNRLSAKAHMLSGIPIILSGIAGTFFVTSANAWMNSPSGFKIVSGKLVGVNPWAAMFNASTGPETTHQIFAAFLVTGFCAASVYAVAMLRGKRGRYYMAGLLIPLVFALIATPFQVVSGDWAARNVSSTQPTKLAAMEGLSKTTKGAPLSLLGYYSNGKLHGAIKIPDGLSLIDKYNPHAKIQGLDATPVKNRPGLVTLVHLAFDAMVAIGTGFFLLALWFAWVWWRKRAIPKSKWFLRAVAVSGGLAIVATELGWIVTEVGRQPWIVYKVLRVADAANPEPGIQYGFYALILIYAVLTVILVKVLRYLARQPLPASVLENDAKHNHRSDK
ncbi:MAG: cytochrome ubiquinol oxidase subunit I [Candidatus Saccharimonadales bacterium]